MPNPPVEDAACGEADKSLCLPREMQSLFHRGYTQKIILEILYICLWLFFPYALRFRLKATPHKWS